MQDTDQKFSSARLARTILNAWRKADEDRWRSALARPGRLCLELAPRHEEAERLQLLAGIASHLDRAPGGIPRLDAGIPHDIETDLLLLAHLAAERCN